MRKKVIDLIKRLQNEGKISEKEYELIYPWGSRPGILYGSPKLHKPIMNYCLKFHPIFSSYFVNEFLVHDSFSFADEVSSFCLDHFMASLDVESLLTNYSFK